jgi:putative ABC transport system permease protein
MDLKFALRSIARSPGFALLSILILALGIGANTAIFSVVYGVVLRPLSYSHPEQLVAITTAWGNRCVYCSVSGPNFLDYQSGSNAFQSMAVYSGGIMSVVANGKAESVGATSVSNDFLKTLAVETIAGRPFANSEFDGPPRVALVSLGFWQRHFGNQPFQAGHILRAAGLQLEIVGLLPAGFHFPEQSQTEVWAPLGEALKDTSRSSGNYQAFGRLNPGVTVEQAQAQLSTISARLAKAYPDSNKDARAHVAPLNDFSVRSVKTNLYVLMGAVALVLLIACANIANLLLARGSGRMRELAIRAAIGASRLRIVRQLLTETLVLAIAGAVGGVVLADAILPLLISMAPSFVPRLNDIYIDWPVLSFCGGSGVFVTLLFGLAPAWQAGRADPNRDLRSGGARGIAGMMSARLRQIFVTVEIALCLTLLVSAGLVLRSFAALTSVDLGFQPQNLLVAQISYAGGADGVSRLFRPLLGRVSEISGVESAALSRELPGENRTDVNYIVTGQPMSAFNVHAPSADVSIVSDAYFDTMRIPLLSGRAFTPRDDPQGVLTAIVNRAFVRQSFADQNPIGKRIYCGADLVTMKWVTIVGVAADAHLDGARSPAIPEIYLPYLQHPRSDMNLIVKTRTNPIGFAEPVRSTISALASESTLKMTTMESHLATTLASPRFSSFLISAFAALAMILAAVGIYGVVAYSVSQRTGEIGLRMALGAKQATVLSMVLIEALKLALAGLVVGLAGAIVAARLLASQLFQVSAGDPTVYGGTVILLLVVAVMAALIPAWRASRVEPVEALRQD